MWSSVMKSFLVLQTLLFTDLFINIMLHSLPLLHQRRDVLLLQRQTAGHQRLYTANNDISSSSPTQMLYRNCCLCYCDGKCEFL